jgi:nucleotide-binding universal stress UspA family protein
MAAWDPARESIKAEVEILERVETVPPEEAVASEARKGYDLLVIGLDPTVGPEGGFHPQVTRAAEGFEGPLAIVTARRGHEDDPLGSDLDILVPVTGTEVSRRGAEVALTLARASNAPVTALYVTGAGPRPGRNRRRALRHNEAILREMVKLAEQYGVSLRTAIRVNMAPAEAILRQARLGSHNLIVMGVTRRAGETLAFGEVAETVLEACERSLLFVAT